MRRIVFLVALTAMAAVAQPSFRVMPVWTRNLPALLDPTMVRIADVNRDGIPDIVLADSYALVTLLGSRDGSFRRVETPANVERFVVQDIDRDGMLDVLGVGARGISFLHGNGDGTFTKPVISEVPWPAILSLPAVADFDGDGIPDLACIRGTDPEGSVYLSVFRGLVNGSFQQSETMVLGPGSKGLVAGDFDGDGKIDLLVGSRYLLPGTGDGRFCTIREAGLPPLPYDAAAADLNGDGITDVVLPGVAGLSVYLGQRGGGFALKESHQAEGAVMLKDLDGDGKVDLISIGRSDGAISLYHGNGDGSFQDAQTIATAIGRFGLSAELFDVADLDGDGFIDFALIPEGRPFSLLYAAQSPSGSKKTEFSYAPYLWCCTVADVNGDGLPDIIASPDPGDASYLTVFPGVGGGAFGEPILLRPGLGKYFFLVDAIDLNGDGRADLVATDGDFEATSSVLLSSPDGGFAEPAFYAGGLLYDVNGDHLPDLVTAGQYSITVSINDGRGHFGPAISSGLCTSYCESGYPVVGDFDGDGKPDLLIPMWEGSDYIGFAAGNGDGSFRPVRAAFPGCDAIAGPADFNGDRIPDLLAACGGTVLSRPDTLTLLLGKGDGSFTGTSIDKVCSSKSAERIADFNSDRISDLLITCRQPDGSYISTVLLSNGDGSFRPAAVLPGDRSLLADVDGDGKVDVLAGNQLFIGNGDGTFRRPVTLPLSGSYAFTLADIDGDGKPDLIASNGNSILVLKVTLEPTPR